VIQKVFSESYLEGTMDHDSVSHSSLRRRRALCIRAGDAQLIMRLEAGGHIEAGGCMTASDHRKDGQAAGYQAVHGD